MPVPRLLGQDLCYAVISTKSWRPDERNSPRYRHACAWPYRDRDRAETLVSFNSATWKVSCELSHAKLRLIYVFFSLSHYTGKCITRGKDAILLGKINVQLKCILVSRIERHERDGNSNRDIIFVKFYISVEYAIYRDLQKYRLFSVTVTIALDSSYLLTYVGVIVISRRAFPCLNGALPRNMSSCRRIFCCNFYLCAWLSVLFLCKFRR